MASRRVEHNRLHRFIRLAEVRHWPARSACRVLSGVGGAGPPRLRSDGSRRAHGALGYGHVMCGGYPRSVTLPHAAHAARQSTRKCATPLVLPGAPGCSRVLPGAPGCSRIFQGAPGWPTHRPRAVGRFTTIDCYQALCFTMLHHLVADTMADILAFMQVRVAPALDAAAAAADDVDEMMDAQADDDAAAMGVSACANCTAAAASSARSAPAPREAPAARRFGGGGGRGRRRRADSRSCEWRSRSKARTSCSHRSTTSSCRHKSFVRSCLPLPAPLPARSTSQCSTGEVRLRPPRAITRSVG